MGRINAGHNMSEPSEQQEPEESSNDKMGERSKNASLNELAKTGDEEAC